FFGVNPTHFWVNGIPFPAVWCLHFATIVMFVPAVIAKCTDKRNQPSEWINEFAPGWMQRAVQAFFVYAIFNFLFTILYLNECGGPDKLNGELVLQNHGHVIRQLTPEEFEKHEAYVVRTFSGHWMLFSSLALMLLVASDRARKASNLERVSADKLPESMESL